MSNEVTKHFFESYDKKFSLLSQQRGSKKVRKKNNDDGKKISRK
ncbi:MAG: hypothetical protein RJA25_59 [Bacteroidota bacterium]|jgi:hypothetical protein